MPAHLLFVAVIALSACRVDYDFTETVFLCQESPVCPGEQVCVGGVCRDGIDEDAAVPGGDNQLHTITPVRIFDQGLAADSLACFEVSTHVPDGATSIAVSVSASNAPTGGFLTLYPKETLIPLVSSVTYSPGRTMTSFSIVNLGDDDSACVYSVNPADVTVDLLGYFESDAGFSIMTPFRVADTRLTGTPPSGPTCYPVTGPDGVPTSAVAVAFVVVGVEPEASGSMVVHPSGTPVPVTTSLQHIAGSDASAGGVSALGEDGGLCISSERSTDHILDITGYFTDESAFVATTGDRRIESSPTDGATECFVADSEAIPESAHALALSVTANAPSTSGELAVFPKGSPTSFLTVKFNADEPLSNGTVVEIGADRSVCVDIVGETGLFVDVLGYW